MKSRAAIISLMVATLAVAGASAQSDISAPASSSSSTSGAPSSAPVKGARPTKPSNSAAIAAPQLAFPPRAGASANADASVSPNASSQTAPSSSSPSTVVTAASDEGKSALDAPTVSENVIHFTNTPMDSSWPFGDKGDTGFGKHYDNTGVSTSVDQSTHYIVHDPSTDPNTSTNATGAKIGADPNTIPGIMYFTPGSPGGASPKQGSITLELNPSTLPGSNSGKNEAAADMTVVAQVLNNVDYGSPEIEALVCGHIVTVGISSNAQVHLGDRKVSVHDLPDGKFIKMTGVWQSSSHFVADTIDAS